MVRSMLTKDDEQLSQFIVIIAVRTKPFLLESSLAQVYSHGAKILEYRARGYVGFCAWFCIIHSLLQKDFILI